jgi:mono/diheme cytochrome c family protein
MRLSLVGLLLAAACGKTTRSAPAKEEADIFHNVCARCHGKDGTGGPPDSLGNPGPKNFTDPAFQSSMTDAQIRNTIENGHRAMPAFGAVFTPAQIDMLVAHVRKFAPVSAASSTPSSGARVHPAAP